MIVDWGEVLAQIKIKLGISSAEIARRMGVKPQLINDIEKGRSKNPSSEFVLNLINRIGINPDYLTGTGPLFKDANSSEQMSDSNSNVQSEKCNTVLHLTWKDRMARIRDIIGMEPDAYASQLQSDWGIVLGLSNGKTKEPSPDQLKEIIKVFDLNPVWVETGQEPVFRKGSKWHKFEQKHRRAESDTAELENSGSMTNSTHQHSDLQALPFQGAKTLQQPGAFLIPLIDQPVSAGGGVVLAEQDEVSSFIPVPKALKRYGTNLAAVPVRGDSMEPTIGHDDMVVCDTSGWEGDGVYVLRMRDGAYVKRLAMRPRGIRVISDNKAYEPYDVDPDADEVAVVGRVRCVLKVMR